MTPEERLIKRLMTAVKCSVCGSNYETGDVSVLGHQQELWFMTVACSRCHTRGLVAALVRDARHAELAETQSSPTASVESTPASPERARSPETVTADDVLDMHQFLSGFDGDFARLFKQADGT